MRESCYVSADEAPRTRTRQVMVGNVPVGGGAPVSVQSMCTTRTDDAKATLAQIQRLADAGCEIIRCAVPNAAALDGFEAICAESPLPVVADIHFDHNLAIGAAQRGAAALRINPGNIGSFERVDAVIDEAGQRGIPIRIGVNAGSLDEAVAERTDLTQPQKLVASCASFVHHFEERGFSNIVLSAKAHSVPVTIETYRMLSEELPILLEEGIGDTMRLSLTADPVEEVDVAWELLSALGMRRLRPELVSCPTCGRTRVNLIGMAEEVAQRLRDVRAPISVAVMGCIVNGPGEARDADIGIACGQGRGMIFVGGEPLRTVGEEELVDELFKEIAARYGE